MKTLLLMRHAKSSKDTKGPDEERPLSKRGEKDAVKMADLLKEKGLLPDYLLTSNALRARETANAIISAITGDFTVKSTQRLYMAEAPDVLNAIHEIEGNPECLMVIGHNPGLESFLQYMINKVESLPTASVACLTLPIDAWSDLTLEAESAQYELWKPKK